MNFENLKNPEFQEKLRTAKTADELIALITSEGIELSEEQLEVVSGGQEWYECDELGAYPTHG